ncbi:hypothetical protein [Actinacidiphila sp. bgisy160]|uniref:hypothetical protein n=1 Tax=Actinacidiphila sp. bgisy160 TaxID=3413796 RepID=UPI003D7539BE
MLKTTPTTKSGGLLNNVLVAVRRQQSAAAPGSGRHRGRPAGERVTAIGIPGMGAHRRPLDAPGPGTTAAQG